MWTLHDGITKIQTEKKNGTVSVVWVSLVDQTPVSTVVLRALGGPGNPSSAVIVLLCTCSLDHMVAMPHDDDSHFDLNPTPLIIYTCAVQATHMMMIVDSHL